MNSDMKAVLDLVAHFQIEAQKVQRYEENPFVQGDNVAEHLSRAARLLVYIAPDLMKEFPDKPTLIQDVFACLIIHDDDEIIVGFDVTTILKVHNANDAEEIKKFTEAISSLPVDTQKFLVKSFSSFRMKDTLPAKIAKAIDNVTGNQLVIEQQIGLINPDSARFCIEYGQKVMGVSKTTDALVSAQIEQVVEGRDRLKNNQTEIERIAKDLGVLDPAKIINLLEVDILTHVLDKAKANISIQDL